jgi:NitT/TauT family transport system permease protein
MSAGIALGVLAAWELVVRLGVVTAIFLPPPTEVARTMWQAAADGSMGKALGATLLRVIPGLLLGAVPGLLLGLAMGSSNRLRQALDPLVAAVHPMPKIALLPLVMIIFGVGEASKVVVVAIASFFPIAINTMAGVRQISPLYFEVAESYGASRRKIFSRVVFPGALPMALSGLRLSANVAFLVTVAVEILAAETGLGALIWLSWETLRVDLLYAALFVTAVVGLVISLVVQGVTAGVLPWLPKREAAR